MAPRPAPVLTALALTVLLLGGCTSSDGDEPQADDTPGTSTSAPEDSPGSADPEAPTGPACDDVWKVGARLPDDYTACVAGTEQGRQDVTDCLDDTRLVVFDDALWAVTGQEVVEPDASPLQDTEAYGAAYSECTGE